MRIGDRGDRLGLWNVAPALLEIVHALEGVVQHRVRDLLGNPPLGNPKQSFHLLVDVLTGATPLDPVLSDHLELRNAEVSDG